MKLHNHFHSAKVLLRIHINLNRLSSSECYHWPDWQLRSFSCWFWLSSYLKIYEFQSFQTWKFCSARLKKMREGRKSQNQNIRTFEGVFEKHNNKTSIFFKKLQKSFLKSEQFRKPYWTRKFISSTYFTFRSF